MVLFVSIAISHQAESDTDNTLSHEIHLGNFFFFVIDYLIFFSILEDSRHETKCNIVEKLVVLGGTMDEKAFENLKQILE